jgi:hypothetical protein
MTVQENPNGIRYATCGKSFKANNKRKITSVQTLKSIVPRLRIFWTDHDRAWTSFSESRRDSVWLYRKNSWSLRDSRSVDDPFRDLNSINDKLTASASKSTDLPQNG